MSTGVMSAGFGFGRDRVEKQLADRVRGQGAQFLHAAVTGEPGGVPHQLSEPRMVGVLVFNQARREHDARPHAPENTGQFDGVSDTDFEMGVAVELDEFERRAEQRGGFFCFGGSLRGRAVGCGFAARADDKMRRAAGARLARDQRRRNRIRCRRDARQRPAAAPVQEGSSV